MTDSERNFVRGLFVRYCSHYDAKRRAVAYCVLLGGIPTSKIGKMRLMDFDGQLPRRFANSRPFVYVTAYEAKASVIDDMGQCCVLGDKSMRLVTLDERPLFVNEQALSDALREYIRDVRGIAPGALFTQQRRAKGKTDEAPPPFSAQTAILCLRPTVNDLGFGGRGQHLQFHRL